MDAFTIGEAAARALAQLPARTTSAATGTRLAPQSTPQHAPHRTPHRTGAPVRRDSVEAGTFEDMFFRVPGKGECDRMLRAARAALDAGRRLRRAARAEARMLEGAEAAIAALTAGAVRVYEELCALARLNRGRVYPSYDRLARATALGRATVARALDRLEAAGFLLRQRRFARVEGEGAGPRYAQTSNAYRLALPAGIAAWLPRGRAAPSLTPAPVPDDALQREAEAAHELAAMRATLSAREIARESAGGALGRVLAKLGAAIDRRERESRCDPEPLPQNHLMRKMESRPGRPTRPA